MSRDELIELGRKIVELQGSEEEINNWIELFNKNVSHPNGANLFYYPGTYNEKNPEIDITNYNPTVEEVVDKCLAYKPIITPFRGQGGSVS